MPKSTSPNIHHCKGQSGLCGRAIPDMDWQAGFRRCVNCRRAAAAVKVVKPTKTAKVAKPATPAEQPIEQPAKVAKVAKVAKSDATVTEAKAHKIVAALDKHKLLECGGWSIEGDHVEFHIGTANWELRFAYQVMDLLWQMAPARDAALANATNAAEA